jgi:glutamate 5-kinase
VSASAPFDADQPTSEVSFDSFELHRQVRQSLSVAKNIVIKVGSRTLTNLPDLPVRLAEQFRGLKDAGRRVVLVSSGAVALGVKRLGLDARPSELALLQAAAAAGQADLVRRYDEAFSPYGLVPAQVLLTHGDLSNRKRLNNARAALGALIDCGAIPIINENDTVSIEELRFSDNDQLSALVTPLVDADALILLTDVDGVLDEQGARISFMQRPEDFVDQGAKDNVGRGGMAGKLNAATQARRAGATVVIASASTPRVIERVLSGEDLGTCFPRLLSVLRAKHHWIAYTLRPRGTVVVDEGAERALRHKKTSLLPVGVLGVRGEFRRADAVIVVNIQGQEIGRGLSRLSSVEVTRSAGKKGAELAALLGGPSDDEVIHRDDLVIWE